MVQVRSEGREGGMEGGGKERKQKEKGAITCYVMGTIVDSLIKTPS